MMKFYNIFSVILLLSFSSCNSENQENVQLMEEIPTDYELTTYDDFQSNIDKGVELASNRNYESAEVFFKAALEQDSINPIVYSNLAIIESKKGKKKIAIKYLDKAIELDKTRWEFRLNRGLILYEEKEYNKALLDLKFAYSKSSKNTNAIWYLARTQYELKNYNSAITYYNKFIAIDNTDADVFYNKSNALMQVGRNNEALKSINKAIDLNSYCADCYETRGYINSELGKYDKACSDFEASSILGSKSATQLYHENCQ